MKKIFFLILIFTATQAQNRLIKFVNPFIGTSGHGHTFPGATLPFGMVQLSPDTDTQGWDWCSGYHYSDSTILGFSHTHLSGTGAGDFGDILFMPLSEKNTFEAGEKGDTKNGYRSKFSHTNEFASPGFYSVLLDDEKIKVELTATERCGFHKYTYDSVDNIKLLINLEHGIQDKSTETYFRIVDDYSIEGYRTSTGWAKKHKIYFYAVFSRKIVSSNIKNQDKSESRVGKGRNIKALIGFERNNSKILTAKVGISHTSIKGAKLNLVSEIGKESFEKIKNLAESKWEKELNKIFVYGKDRIKKIVFYTALYHSFISPNLLSDIDGNYIGMDKRIHSSVEHKMYNVFSLWDTFRALHPLIYLVDKERAEDFVISLIEKGKQNNVLPVWELASNETGTMIGYHSVPVIAEAIMKNIGGFDYEEAYREMIKSSMQDTLGINYLKKIGFIPMDKEDDAVSRTLEYAYDDWCIAQIAKKLNKPHDYEYFIQRAMNYKNVFDKTSGFMRGRYFDGRWKIKFDPEEPFPLGAGEFTEGSSWQYSWFVPHDVSGLINLMGGEEKFSEKLDLFFNSKADGNYYVPADVTGLIGQYAHGNEPSHHIAYLNNFVGQPQKTQALVRKIMNEMYSDKNDGLIGNEDCGQMSAWYVFSSLGFYPVNPVSNIYITGSGIFDSVRIDLAFRGKLTIEYRNNSEENIYISSILIDNYTSDNSFISYNDLMKAGKITFVHSAIPSNEFGHKKNNMPESFISEKYIPSEKKVLFPPSINTIKTIFRDSLKIELQCITEGAEIEYMFGDAKQRINFLNYESPIIIRHSSKLNYRSRKGNEVSPIITVNLEKGLIPEKSDFPKLILQSKFSEQYAGTGNENLLDGIRATDNFRDGFWQGFYGKDFEAIIDLGKQIPIEKIKAGFLSNQGSWIFLPRSIEVYSSQDGVHYELTETKNLGEPEEYYEIRKFDYLFNLDISTRFIKIKANSIGKCPSWHNGKGYDSWLFIDEIVITPED